MTHAEQNTAIAEACGWTGIENKNTIAIGGVWRGYPPSGAVVGNKELIPNYTNDLNAIHAAELTLTDAEYQTFYYWLTKLHDETCMPVCRCKSAKAPKRAEAFLRTKGLWKE